jgi:hypothetical protein
MSILKVKMKSVVAVAVIVTALVALSSQVPQAVLGGGARTVERQESTPNGSSVTISSWAVKGTVQILYPPCPYGVVCSPIYEIKGIGGPACAFQNPTAVSQTVCAVPVQRGTWIMYFTPCFPTDTICPQYMIKPPKQGQHIIAYGTEIVPSKNGSSYAGDLYVSSWIRVKSNTTT